MTHIKLDTCFNRYDNLVIPAKAGIQIYDNSTWKWYKIKKSLPILSRKANFPKGIQTFKIRGVEK